MNLSDSGSIYFLETSLVIQLRPTEPVLGSTCAHFLIVLARETRFHHQGLFVGAWRDLSFTLWVDAHEQPTPTLRKF